MIDENGVYRCDAERSLNGPACLKPAKWTIKSKWTYLHYCDRHKEDRREPEHFVRAPFAEWERLS